MNIIPPNSTIGILGGGQLGRMIALAAARLGYKCHIFHDTKDAPALQVTQSCTIGDFTDYEALARFAASVDVVTSEWENVPLAALEVLSSKVPVYPSAGVQKIAQDRILEKQFAKNIGVGTAEFAAINSASELDAALKVFSRPAILKSTRMGYDGKGQVKIDADTDADTDAAVAWRDMGGEQGILEAFVDFDREVSVIVARRADGAMATYPVVENIHKNHILDKTIAPAQIDKKVAEEARLVAMKIAEAIKVVGLLAIEMFVLKRPDINGRTVLMNEIAPRPHNSGHWTIDACPCSQFEQLVRAICGLPLGSTTPNRKAVMENLIGDDILRADELLKNESACLHLYGKTEVRDGRKMGHVTFIGDNW